MRHAFLKNIFFVGTFLLAILPVLAVANNYNSKVQDYSGTWWFNLGLGFGYLHDNHWHDLEHESETDGAVLGTISFNYATFDNQLLTLRLTGVGEILDDGTNSVNGTTDGAYKDEVHENFEGLTEIGVLYGLMHKSKYFLASAATGLAYVGANYETHQHKNDGDDFFDDGTEFNQEKHTVSTIGLPLEAQVFLTPASFFGIGLIGTANVNSQVPFAGVMLGFQIGDLR